MECMLLYHVLTVKFWPFQFASFLARLALVVVCEAFIHSLLHYISAFADLFQFSLQEFKKVNSGMEEVGEVDKL